jgi:crotonobetainyl-CoA:carnitine CoA-transferase CaiB-like acyl-CoA transferase
MTGPTLPLRGIDVIEIAQNLAGPYAGEILARLGASVVKIERPEGGDDARGWGPPFLLAAATSFHAVNAGKRSITLDLRDASGVAWLRERVQRADVLVQNLRPGVLEDLGLGAGALRALNPRLVYCSVSAFGRQGPMRDRPGYEPMVQAFAGLMMVGGRDGDPPARIGVPILDYGSGLWAALGVIAGLLQRQHTGQGCVVDASLFETALAWLGGHLASFSVTGQVPVRHPTGSPRLIPFQAFETKTGPVIVAAGNDRLFAALARALDRPEWASDPRFRTNADRFAHREELLGAIAEIIRGRTAGEWVDRLEQAGVPCAPVHGLREVLAEPQTLASGMVQRVPGLDLELMALPLTFDGVRPPIPGRAPDLGEHNTEILGQQ